MGGGNGIDCIECSIGRQLVKKSRCDEKGDTRRII